MLISDFSEYVRWSQRTKMKYQPYEWTQAGKPYEFLVGVLYEPPHDKTNKMACAPSQDSDQPGHPPSLIRVFTVRMKKAWALSYPLSAQRRPVRLGRCPGWSESSLGSHAILLVLSCCGSYSVDHVHWYWRSGYDLHQDICPGATHFLYAVWKALVAVRCRQKLPSYAVFLFNILGMGSGSSELEKN